jgi:hypothetical protein
MDRFVSMIKPSLPGCPASLIKSEVLDAAIRFCRKTYVWKSVETDTAVGGETEWSLAGVTGADIINISVEVNDREYVLYTFSVDTAKFDYPLKADDEVSVTLYLSPSRDVTELPDVLYTDYFEAIRSGAIVSLAMLPNKPWSDPSLAAAHQRTYLHEIGNAAGQAQKKNLQHPHMIQMRPWI